MQRAHKRIVECFPISRVYQAHIPTYPSGHWLFGFASKKYHPVTDFNPTAWTLLGLSTRYYNAKLHRSAFSLPTYVGLLRDSGAAIRREIIMAKLLVIGCGGVTGRHSEVLSE